MRRLKGQRIFERVLVTLSWKWARSLERLFGTRGFSRSCGCWWASRCSRPLWPLYRQGLRGRLPSSARLRSRLPRCSGSIGRLCAIGAAYQAKYHRLAALVLLGGAGLVTCITFVWFSAPDLAITQLLVEIVTTVLILLGLRWLPKRIETAGEGLTMAMPGQVAAHAGSDARRRGRHGHDAGRLRDDDAAAARTRSRATSSRTPMRRAAAATSSTSSWSTSAASTPSARSWCSPSWR